jgi:hypothetical protein
LIAARADVAKRRQRAEIVDEQGGADAEGNEHGEPKNEEGNSVDHPAMVIAQKTALARRTTGLARSVL